MTAPEPLTLVELVRHLGEHDYWLGYDSSGMYIAMPVDKDSPAACGTGGTPWEAANEAMPGHPVVARDDAAELLRADLDKMACHLDAALLEANELRAALELLLNASHRGGYDSGLTLEAVERAEALIAPGLTQERRIELAHAAWLEGLKRRLTTFEESRLAATEGQP